MGSTRKSRRKFLIILISSPRSKTISISIKSWIWKDAWMIMNVCGCLQILPRLPNFSPSTDSPFLLQPAKETFLGGLEYQGEVTAMLNSPGNDEIDFRTNFDSSSQISDKEKTCSCNPEVKLSNYPEGIWPVSEDAEYLEDLGADEPLFWPFELERCWNSEESWKCFTMSPRKDMRKFGNNPEGTCKMHSKETCRRRAVINSGSTAAKMLELKQRNNNKKSVKKLNNMPSRLRNSNKISAKIVPLEIADDIKEPIDKDGYLFQDVFAVNQEVPIEKFLGLSEFDGHEGVGSDLNVDVFFLEESL
ncbi:hypothetical protein Patl1_26309 [Pistacia atlantica]|uniref:Uncharacterized protein n=1 Tax=Pistacia atlantica TaxID=434234 RepID=A0ACC1AZD5_9ROSI|nr:hypothetical protein Patl1_26309 [Pistacia atlantica]